MIKSMKKTDCLSRNNTVAIKGLLALVVFICHLPSYLGLLSDSILGRMIGCLGSPAVGIFFFLSGYGLFFRFQVNADYLTTFWKHKIVPFVLNYLLLLCLYIFAFFLAGEDIIWWRLVQSFLLGGYVQNGWYLQVQFWLYVIFWCVYRRSMPTKQKNTVILIIILLFYVFGISLNLQGTFYISTILFWVGLIWGRNRGRINVWIERHCRLSLFLGFSCLLFGTVCIVFRGLISKYAILGYIVTTFSDVMICVGFVLMINYITVDCPLTRILGKYSFEIYVLQGLSFLLFSRVCFQNVYINCVLSFLLTCVFSFFLHPFFSGMYIKCRALNNS